MSTAATVNVSPKVALYRHAEVHGPAGRPKPVCSACKWREMCLPARLDDTEVCIMRYGLIEDLSREIRGLQRQLHAVFSGEIVRDRDVMMLLGSMSAEQRLAAFLLNLSRRYIRRGYSGSEFILRMTREEIGSYLGLNLETVSRKFTQFCNEGLLEVYGRQVRLVNLAGFEAWLSRSRAGVRTRRNETGIERAPHRTQGQADRAHGNFQPLTFPLVRLEG